MVEMTEAANILNNAAKNSLLILDEIGRGATTADGLSIAQAVLEYIAQKIKAKTLFATHYHELTETVKQEGVANYHLAVENLNGEVVFLRKLKKGPTSESYGIHVAKMAGVPDEVTERAFEILKSLGKSTLKIKANNKANKKVFDKELNKELNFVNKDNDYANQIVNKIKNLDLNNITPIESLKILFELKATIHD
jgi:DNA mismatch repair protein MutS